MQSTSIFDLNTFLETTHKGNLDTHYVLPDPGDYPAQITDKIEVRSGIVGEGKQNAGAPWASLDIQWELLDDTLRSKLNMDRVFVRQSFMLDLTSTTPPTIDLGTNKNMRLKRLWEATGVNRQKQVSIAALKFQQGLVHVEHRHPEGFDDPIAEITRVTDISKAHANGAA